LAGIDEFAPNFASSGSCLDDHRRTGCQTDEYGKPERRAFAKPQRYKPPLPFDSLPDWVTVFPAPEP
jgi:hypothetical protein